MAKYMFLAPGSPLPFSPLSQEAFEEIKRGSCKAWKQQALQNEDCCTTYSGAYRNMEVNTVAQCRGRVSPSSPTRMHRPHPPEVFLVNQLHHLPGHYGNAKQQRVTMDKGFHPRSAFPSKAKGAVADLGDSYPPKINHNTVIVASPVTPLDAIQQWIKQDSLNAIIIGNRFGQEIEVPSTSSVSKDIIVIPTGISSSDRQQMWDSEETTPDTFTGWWLPCEDDASRKEDYKCIK